MICLDSSALIDFLDPDAEHHEEARAVVGDRPNRVWAAPAVVLYELYLYGAGRESGRLEALADRLEWVEPVSFDEGAAREAALIRAELMAEGTPINETDLLIAGVARASGAPIVARDRDFDRVDGLSTIEYVASE